MLDGSVIGSLRAAIVEREYELVPHERGAIDENWPVWQAANRVQDFRTVFTERGTTTTPRARDRGAWSLGLEVAGIGRRGATRSAPADTVRVDGARLDCSRGILQEWFENGPAGLRRGYLLERPPTAPARADGRTGVRNTSFGEGEDVDLDLSLAGTLVPRLAGDGAAIDFVTPAGQPALRLAGLAARDATDSPLPVRFSIVSSGFRGGGPIVRVSVDDTNAVYPLAIEALESSAAWMGEGEQVGALFGFSVASAGDVNDDGYDDLIVGAPFYDNGLVDTGAVFVFHGSPSGLSATVAWMTAGIYLRGEYGNSVAGAGDVNGDGYDDVIVGAHHDSVEGVFAGRVYVYYGSAGGLPATASWSVMSDQAGANLGSAVASAGDVNNDGYDDVIIGSSEWTNGQSNEGRVLLYLGSTSGLSSTSTWEVEADRDFAGLGASVAAAGDVDGDGTDDIIVGAPGYGNGQKFEGLAFVYLGSSGGLSGTPVWTGEANQFGANFGTSVAGAGDVNGDGYDDVIVGAPFFDNGETNEGRAYLYYGSSTGPSTTASWTGEVDRDDADFGISVAGAGDVNGDTFADVIVGAYGWSNDLPDEGAAFVYHGSASGLGSVPVWSSESNQAAAELGFSVAGAGDVNGDGYSDVVTGARYYTDPEITEGAAWVYHGSPAVGAGSVPDGAAGVPLTVAPEAGGAIRLDWGISCVPTDTDFAVYEGTIGAPTSHAPVSCTTSGATTFIVTPGSGSTYYLVVPHNGAREGSYGALSTGVERPASATGCFPQQIGFCW